MLKFEVSAEVWMLHFFLKVARLYPKTKLMDKLHSYCITNDTVYLEHRHRVLLKNSIQLMVAKYCYLFLPRFCLWGQSASEKITFQFISSRVAFIFLPCTASISSSFFYGCLESISSPFFYGCYRSISSPFLLFCRGTMSSPFLSFCKETCSRPSCLFVRGINPPHLFTGWFPDYLV